jgi:nucleotide-binding universal stress UspA family protein
MTYLVPFDNSQYARAALVRGAELADALDEELVSVSVVPKDRRYAREKNWLDDDEPFAVGKVVGRLRQSVDELAPDARFRAIHVEGRARHGTIAGRLRDAAHDEDADVVAIGSDNAGRVMTPVGSVGGNVAADDDYDVFLVRTLPSGLGDFD